MLNIFESFLLLVTFFFSIYSVNYIYFHHINTKGDVKGDIKENIKMNFMGCVLLIFGILKLYDIQKFAAIFKKYDIISRKIVIYAYIYPFIEIALGLAYLKRYNITIINNLTIALMTISIISVLISITKGQELRCGCMGSFFHIPLSYVSLSENISMLFLILIK